jgi:DNA repair protein RecN (Recombination protein N)
MLLHLIIENFVLLDKMELDFSRGLCVITGETGAGKSMIVDAIEGIVGGRLSPEQIKTNCKSSNLEATFQMNPFARELLKENGFDELEDTVTLSRTIQRSGNKCRINGQLVTQNFLRQVGEYLIDIIGQNENQYLFKVEHHRQIIDFLGDDKHKKYQEKIKDISLKLNLVRKEYLELEKASHENKRQIDFFKFQLKEIEEANLKIGEDEDLKKEREILVHAEELTQNLTQAYHELYLGDDAPSICDRLNSVSRLISVSAKYDTSLESINNDLENISAQLNDFSRVIREHSERVESDPEQLEELEGRLDTIQKMRNKYGPAVEDVLKYRDELRGKVNLVESSEDRLNELQKTVVSLEKEYKNYAGLLSESRIAIAAHLEPRVEQELSELGMEKTRFKVNFAGTKETFSENGTDILEFLISPNPGEPLRPLSKIASGGECSRLMLALKMVLHKSNQVPTLIFDEIDAGISGKAALVVSQKLAKLSKISQILCITHLPVVAAMSDQHLWIEKYSTDDYTKIDILDLNENLRVEKLAQMSGGKISKTSLKYARDIYQNALDYKKSSGLLAYSRN